MKIRPSRLAAAAIGVAAFGAASAASLGGLASTSVGSNDTVVAACDTDGVAISYTTAYSASASKYQVTAVTISGVAAACATQTAAVTLKSSDGTSIGTGTAAVSGTTQTIPVTPAASADAVVGASIVISG